MPLTTACGSEILLKSPVEKARQHGVTRNHSTRWSFRHGNVRVNRLGLEMPVLAGSVMADNAYKNENKRPATRRHRYVPSREDLKYGFRAYLVSHVCRIIALSLRCSVPIGIVWIGGEAWVRRTALLAGKTTAAKIDEYFSVCLTARGDPSPEQNL